MSDGERNYTQVAIDAIRADERARVLRELEGPHAREVILAALHAEHQGAPCWTQAKAVQSVLASLLAPEGEGGIEAGIEKAQHAPAPVREETGGLYRLTLEHGDRVIARIADLEAFVEGSFGAWSHGDTVWIDAVGEEGQSSCSLSGGVAAIPLSASPPSSVGDGGGERAEPETEPHIAALRVEVAGVRDAMLRLVRGNDCGWRPRDLRSEACPLGTRGPVAQIALFGLLNDELLSMDNEMRVWLVPARSEVPR